MVNSKKIFNRKRFLLKEFDLILSKIKNSFISFIRCGAAPLSEEIAKMVAKRLNVPTIKQGYGLTETTLAVMNSPDNNTEYKSVGTLVPGIAGKILKICFINFIFMNINYLSL